MRKEVLALKNFLSQQKLLYQKMFEISLSQKEGKVDVEFLFATLREKQRLVLEIEQLDEKMIGLKEWWKVNKTTLPEEDRIEITRLFSEIEEILQELLKLEGIIAEKVKGNQKELERELGKVSAGKRAVKAYYGKKGARESRFVDRRQ